MQVNQANRAIPTIAGAVDFQPAQVRHTDVWKAPLHDLTLRDELLSQFLPLPGDAEALEVGPGTGFTAYWLARQVKHLTLLDIAQQSIERLKQTLANLNNVSFVCADACDASLPNVIGRTFDVAYALDVLELVPDPAACIRNLGEVLRPNGVLLLAWPNYPPAESEGVSYLPSRRVLESILNDAGFRRWDIGLLQLKPLPKFVYRQFHERPLELYRKMRKPAPTALPQTYDETWAHQNQHVLERFKWILHSYWAMLSLAMRTTGTCFDYREPSGDNLEGHALVVARR